MPNETNWQDITRRLDINEASVTDTCYPKARGKGRAIKKVPFVFTIPSQIVSAPGDAYYGRITAQQNCVAPRSFKIIQSDNLKDVTLAGPVPNYAIYIRYRDGNTIHRYRLAPVILDPIILALYDAAFRIVQGTQYNGEIIKANFVIEWWKVLINNAFMRSPSYKITTNIIEIPDNSDQTEASFLTTETAVTRAELVSTFPEALPTVYGQVSNWLTN